jgi:hypothetical protein
MEEVLFFIPDNTRDYYYTIDSYITMRVICGGGLRVACTFFTVVCITLNNDLQKAKNKQSRHLCDVNSNGGSFGV